MDRVAPSIDEIFFAALEVEGPAARAAYLAEACGPDTELLRHVERMLAASPLVSNFLESPAPAPTVTADSPAQECAGAVIGPYKLLEPIGEGGMGTVFMAEQTHPVRRKVALKVIKPGMDTKQVLARFEAERQALALMDHPNIAKVLDAGTTDVGRPYFVMELVRGVSITAYCDQEQLSVGERLELFVSVCRAVQHAHQKGVIHRDLKPSNILVTLHDGEPVPKVIDFGIAKATGQSLTERTLFTGFAQLVGTPLYMSPEQAELSGLDVDTRSDVYSLGVLLYELLTGTTPFDGETLRRAAVDEMRRIIREDEPPRPSIRLSSLGEELTTVSVRRKADPRRLGRSMRGELDWIVMKALEKDRRRRYETASDFATDVTRYLADEPVEACPPSAWYRFGKFARRNRAAMTTAALMTAIIGIGLVTSLWFAVVATKAERRSNDSLAEAKASHGIAEARRAEAIAREREAKSLLARSLIRGGTQLLEEGSGLGLFDLINAHAEADHEPKLREATAVLWAAGIAPLEGRLAAVVEGGGVVAFSPDGRLLATASGGSVILRETSGWQRRVGSLEHGPGKRVVGIQFSPQGSRIATTTHGGEVRLWAVATGRALGAPLRGEAENPTNYRGGLAFSPDGTLLAGSSLDGVACVWDTATGEARGPRVSHGGPVLHVAFSPDGATLATGSNDATVGLWDVKTWEPAGPPLRQEDMIHAMAWSPDGSLLATASGYGKTRLWEVPSGRLRCEPLVTVGWVMTLDFSPCGRWLATGSTDWVARLWDTATGRPHGGPMRHDARVVSVQFSPDGRLLATRALGGSTRLWEVETQEPYGSPLPETEHQGRASFSPDGEFLAVWGPAATRVWRVDQNLWTATFEHGHPVWAVDLSPDGKTLATASGSAVRVWDVGTGSHRDYPLSGVTVDVKNFPFIPTSVKYNPDGTLLAVIDSRGSVRLLDASTHRPVGRALVHPGIVKNLAFSPDGRRLVTSTYETKAEPARMHLWESRTQTHLGSHPADVLRLEVSPDGREVASGTRDWSARMWSLTDGFKLDREIPQNERCLSLGYSADGAWLATGTQGGRANVWATSTGDLRGTAMRLDGPVTNVKLSPDGNLLVTSEWDLVTDRPGPVRFWSLSAGPPYHCVTLPQSAGTLSVSVTPDWRWLAIGQEDGTSRLLLMPAPPATTREMRLRTAAALGLHASGADYEAVVPEEWQAIRRELVTAP